MHCSSLLVILDLEYCSGFLVFLDSQLFCCFSLEDVLMQENKLYLVFEYLNMDLKKYLDSIPTGQQMDRMLIKVVYFNIYT